MICFHKNIDAYPSSWINKCVESIWNQSDKDFDMFEIDYGGAGSMMFGGWRQHYYSKYPFPTHAHAHNFLLDTVFAMDYDCAFNLNIDDFYNLKRVEVQKLYMKAGVDVCSGNFYFVDERDRIVRKTEFHRLHPDLESRKGHNIIGHPGVCYSRNFWLNCGKLNPDEIPRDDFNLWRRSFGKFKFKILPEYLFSYRIHSLKICNTANLQR